MASSGILIPKAVPGALGSKVVAWFHDQEDATDLCKQAGGGGVVTVGNDRAYHVEVLCGQKVFYRHGVVGSFWDMLAFNAQEG